MPNLVKQEAIEESEKEGEGFPWNDIVGLKMSNRKDKVNLKKTLLKSYLSYPAEVEKVLRKYKISKQEWKEWLESVDVSSKQRQLKDVVLDSFSQAGKQMTLTQFKRLACKIYGYQNFEPTTTWCAHFLTRNDLHPFVAKQ